MDVSLFTTDYMRGWLRIAKEGDGFATYPMIETARAICVVPLIEYNRRTHSVLLIEQEGRPETDGKPVLKAIGGYCRDLSAEDAAHAIAFAKAGIKLPALTYLRETTSYSVARAPVDMFMCKGYTPAPGASLAPGCTVKIMSLKRAVHLAADGDLFDPCTVEAIFILGVKYPQD